MFYREWHIIMVCLGVLYCSNRPLNNFYNSLMKASARKILKIGFCSTPSLQYTPTSGGQFMSWTWSSQHNAMCNVLPHHISKLSAACSLQLCHMQEVSQKNAPIVQHNQIMADQIYAIQWLHIVRLLQQWGFSSRNIHVAPIATPRFSPFFHLCMLYVIAQPTGLVAQI